MELVWTATEMVCVHCQTSCRADSGHCNATEVEDNQRTPEKKRFEDRNVDMFQVHLEEDGRNTTGLCNKSLLTVLTSSNK